MEFPFKLVVSLLFSVSDYGPLVHNIPLKSSNRPSDCGGIDDLMRRHVRGTKMALHDVENRENPLDSLPSPGTTHSHPRSAPSQRQDTVIDAQKASGFRHPHRPAHLT